MRALILLSLAASAALARPIDLRCNYLTNPLGVDSLQPRLSWRAGNSERDWMQSAYQIKVASSLAGLRSGHAGIWDSGKQTSAESIGIEYAGPALESGRRYYWTVRVWDANGKAEESEPAWWEMGLLAPTDWKAKWIGRSDPGDQARESAIHWIWVAGQSAPPSRTVAVFRYDFDLAAKPANAALFVAVHGDFKASINGQDAGSKRDFRAFDREDVTNILVSGKNHIEITVTSNAEAGLAGLLEIRHGDGTIERHGADSSWQARLQSDSQFKPAATLGNLNDPRLGADTGPLPSPAGLFRREFAIRKPLRSARLYVTALGSYRAFLNGKTIGADILTPEYTDYAKRVTYQTYDVTSMLAAGPNAIAAILGDGWFGSGLTWTGLRFSFLPPPTRFLAQLQMTFADGSTSAIVTDESWRTAQSPILHSEIYAGEVYDSRLEKPGWEKAQFNDAKWQPAQISDPPPGILSAEVTVPPRVITVLEPKTITQAAKGAWIVDMGQNMVGWLRVKVAGPTGARIRLRFAEILSPDGSLYRDNLRNASSTDVLYLRGGEQVWSPKFTFHGFRYVEVTGFPGKPDKTNFAGEVVSSAQTLTGKLSTSSESRQQNVAGRHLGRAQQFFEHPHRLPAARRAPRLDR